MTPANIIFGFLRCGIICHFDANAIQCISCGSSLEQHEERSELAPLITKKVLTIFLWNNLMLCCDVKPSKAE